MTKDWEIKKLGDICEFQGGSQPPKEEWIKENKDGYIRMLQIRDFTQSRNFDIEYVKKTNKLRYCNVDDILLGRYGASVGKVLTGLEGAYNVAILKTIPSSIIWKPFIKYYFSSPLFQFPLLNLCNQRAAQAGFNREDIFDFPIPVPSLEEQKRIVTILDEKIAQLERLKANAQSNLQNAKDLFQSQLTKAFGNTTWEKKRLGDCGTFKNGMNFAANDSGYTIRSLGVGDFKDRYSIDNTETLSEISLKAAPSEDYLLQDGDIVFVRSNGNKELVGRCLLVYPKDIPTTYSGFCIRFRKDFELLDADFLLHYMKAESSKKILNGKEGANISNLNQKILGDFKVPLPPLPEQKRIVEELDTLSEKVRQLQEIYTKQIANCDELKQSYLQKAFGGEL